ncbi:MAG: hypothetical protein M3Y59_13565 [Myxococcota bacterium]|nr:hypothetical protein [Myxococcota bacterium]
MLRQVRQLALVVAAFGLTGCEKPLSASAAPNTATAPAGAAKVDAFELKVTGPTSATPDQAGELVIHLAAKPGYKINAEYPHNFRPEKDSGVQFDAPRFELTAGTRTPCEKKAEDTCRLEARVPFKATAKGEQKATGVVAFSVCNDEVCLIEKVPVATTVRVN